MKAKRSDEVTCNEALGSEKGDGGCHCRESLSEGCVARISRWLLGLKYYIGEWP